VVLLKEGIAAAKASDKSRARQLFRQTLDLDARNEAALLWLAGLAESPLEAVGHLESVLALNPGHDRALAAVRVSRLQAGIAAAKGQDRPLARRLLLTTVEQDPANEVAWMWLASVAERTEEAIGYLEKVLALNPGNDRAAAGLQRYRAQAAAAMPPSPGPREKEPTPVAPSARIKPPGPTAPPPAREQASPREATDQPSAPAPRRTPPRTPAIGPRKTILVIDDSPTIRKLVSMTVERQGYQARTAGDSYEAIDVLRDFGLPDLILLDIAMPGMDGYELCKLLRQNADTSRIPIIMLSGKDGFFNKMRGRLAGSTEYITKPFEPESLVRVLTKYCPLRAPVAVAAAADG
jgi:twitching motility two-component system response regulator PilG